jgi:hypothetical protein
MAYKQFGTTYKPRTMECHILEAYFRTILGDRWEPANEWLPESKHRFSLAGGFYHAFRPVFPELFEEMNISVGLGEILLGDEIHSKDIKVEPGPCYNELVSTALSKFGSLHFFVTSDGFMGYGPECRSDDVICILFGCSVPLILRPQNGGYVILGQCFVLGLMNGEFFRDCSNRGPEAAGGQVFDIL